MILAAFLGFAAAAYADAFTFSYVINDYQGATTVSGSFDGTQNGNFVTGISNITMEFSGAVNWSVQTPITIGNVANNYMGGSGSYVMSFDILQSNFLLFSGVSSHNARLYVNPTQGRVYQDLQFPNFNSFETWNQASWSLVNTTGPVGSVPDGSTTGVMFAIAMAGLVWLRRSIA